MKRITIIGGGASGTLLASNLLKNAGPAETEINLIEKGSRLGRGVAFGTRQETHLLNVPAGRMGAYPDDIKGFHDWLSENGENYDPDDFVPRMKFGDYLRAVLDKAASERASATAFNLIDDEAIDLSLNTTSAEVILRSGEVLPSDRVVLAFGNFKPPHPSVADLSFTSSPNYCRDPWTSDIYDRIGPDETIFIIGTGLSMVDVVLHFHRLGHRGRISAISTRGLLPAAHKLGYTYPPFADELEPAQRITDLLKKVRQHIAKAEADGSNWRAVIDSLRPVTQRLWLELPLSEKKYFKQHLSRYWNVARHRMPPQAASILTEMRNAGDLEILSGRLRSIFVNERGSFDITFGTAATEKTATAQHLINCIGSEANFDRVDSELVQNLIASGLIRPDSLLLGLDATPDGHVIGMSESPSNIIMTLGTALKGTLWESTAIPEIRTQARDLALKLLAD